MYSEPRVKPGDTILVHAGLYKGQRYKYANPLGLDFHGTYVLTQDGTAERPISIKAAGDGKVIFRGTKSGYGKTVILQHGGNITTLYAHMSNFNTKARLGTRVTQGQTIGYVGMTGLATANHLHYEYRLNGVHRNPRTVALPDADPIDDKYRQRFLAEAAPILEELENYKRKRLATLAYASP